MKRMFEFCDQWANARRAAPVTSLPTLIFGGGWVSEVEKATVTVGFSHLICIDAEALVY